MPTKKGARAKSSSPKRSTGSGLGKRAKKSSSAKGKKNKVAPLTPLTTDILSPSAMLNLNYIAHNAPDALTMRGFPYTGPRAKKGKKGGGKSAKGGKGKKKKKK